jgi:hypothetical protein
LEYWIIEYNRFDSKVEIPLQIAKKEILNVSEAASLLAPSGPLSPKVVSDGQLILEYELPIFF